METLKVGDVRTVNLLVVSVSFHRDRLRASRSRPRHPGKYLLVVAASLFALLSVDAAPAVAMTTGSNAATVQLTPAPIRSVTVTPTTAAFGNCTGPNASGTSSNASELAFPNGLCTVGLVNGNGGITGGVTVTNGTAAGHIDINGQNATPSDNGTSWGLLPSGTPGVDQFAEEINGAEILTTSSNVTALSTVPACDTAFTVTSGAGSCTAAAGQSTMEALVVEGPSSSTDQNGPFTVTTTWTAVP